ncbi:collagen alpha-1(I) chain-like [Poecile atricapillus]|uniref:collagen alpha-1(I) chain-like n=1 Tax=Poecile atricapillus TaxID=48891 RepID=UPI0027382447|nr:collagen alpha-1(I) chain-like [Poecile atricapillus]
MSAAVARPSLGPGSCGLHSSPGSRWRPARPPPGRTGRGRAGPASPQLCYLLGPEAKGGHTRHGAGFQATLGTSLPWQGKQARPGAVKRHGGLSVGKMSAAVARPSLGPGSCGLHSSPGSRWRPARPPPGRTGRGRAGPASPQLCYLLGPEAKGGHTRHGAGFQATLGTSLPWQGKQARPGAVKRHGGLSVGKMSAAVARPSLGPGSCGLHSSPGSRWRPARPPPGRTGRGRAGPASPQLCYLLGPEAKGGHTRHGAGFQATLGTSLPWQGKQARPGAVKRHGGLSVGKMSAAVARPSLGPGSCGLHSSPGSRWRPARPPPGRTGRGRAGPASPQLCYLLGPEAKGGHTRHGAGFQATLGTSLPWQGKQARPGAVKRHGGLSVGKMSAAVARPSLGPGSCGLHSSPGSRWRPARPPPGRTGRGRAGPASPQLCYLLGPEAKGGHTRHGAGFQATLGTSLPWQGKQARPGAVKRHGGLSVGKMSAAVARPSLGPGSCGLHSSPGSRWRPARPPPGRTGRGRAGPASPQLCYLLGPEAKGGHTRHGAGFQATLGTSLPWQGKQARPGAVKRHGGLSVGKMSAAVARPSLGPGSCGLHSSPGSRWRPARPPPGRTGRGRAGPASPQLCYLLGPEAKGGHTRHGAGFQATLGTSLPWQGKQARPGAVKRHGGLSVGKMSAAVARPSLGPGSCGLHSSPGSRWRPARPPPGRTGRGRAGPASPQLCYLLGPEAKGGHTRHGAGFQATLGTSLPWQGKQARPGAVKRHGGLSVGKMSAAVARPSLGPGSCGLHSSPGSRWRPARPPPGRTGRGRAGPASPQLCYLLGPEAKG